jgi:hypothetical protein
VRGLRTELTIDPRVHRRGRPVRFASVLNEFFALYASLNSYHELRVKSTQGECTNGHHVWACNRFFKRADRGIREYSLFQAVLLVIDRCARRTRI